MGNQLNIDTRAPTEPLSRCSKAQAQTIDESEGFAPTQPEWKQVKSATASCNLEESIRKFSEAQCAQSKR